MNRNAISPTKPRKRVLVVDDEELSRELLEAFLTELGHDVDMVDDGPTAMATLGPSHDLALVDVMMAGTDGFEVTRRIRTESPCPDIPICVVTVLSSREDRIRAVQAGANDFISKPIDKTELRLRTDSLFKAKEARDVIKRYQVDLQATVARRTGELQRSLQDTKEEHERAYIANLETIERLAVAAEYRDEDSAFHIRRMSRYTALIARKLNLPAAECEVILYASSMHDIGKIAIPDSILFKPGKLTPAEWVLMKQHPQIGAHILSASSSELLRAGEVFSLTHHEKWNGSGYPQGLAGKTIPLWGRIAAIADVFDALTTRRPYKEAFSKEMALSILHDGRESHFDPTLLDLFLSGIDEVDAIRAEFQDPSTKPRYGTEAEWLPPPPPPLSTPSGNLSDGRVCAAG